MPGCGFVGGEPPARSPEAIGIAERHLSRSRVYRLMSSVFAAEPTAAFLEELTRAAELTDELSSPAEAELLRSVGAPADSGLQSRLQQVRTEYAELFIGPRPPLAPLYESVYIGFPNRLFTDVTRDVRAVYERNGFCVARRNAIPDDHLALELEFMARMAEVCSSDATAETNADLETSLRVQESFLTKHVSRWLPLFLERIEQAYCSDYYRAWTRFVATFVEDDLQNMKKWLPMSSEA